MGGGKRRALILLFVVSCGAGRYPSALSQRPLNLPAGEHQIIVGGGLEGSGRGSASLDLDLGYRYGITDALELALPLVIAYGGPVADNLEVQGQFGVEGIGYGATQTSKYYRIDPRYRTAGRESFYTLFAASFNARSMISGSSALRLGLRSSAYVGGRGLYRPSLIASASASYELGPYFSVLLGISGGLGSESPRGIEDEQLAVISIGSVANGFSPLVAFHLADELDLYAAGFGTYAPAIEEGAFGGTAGIDWHFD